MTNEKKFTSSGSLGNAHVIMVGVKYPDTDILDTEVKIEAGFICCITWKDKEKFLEELNAIIYKYSI